MFVSAETIATLACNDHALKARIEKLQERVDDMEHQLERIKRLRAPGSPERYKVGDLLTWSKRYNAKVVEVVRGEYYKIKLYPCEDPYTSVGEDFYVSISEVDNNDEGIKMITPAR